MLHKHLKVYVSSVTRVVRCPVLWIKCVVNNVNFVVFCLFFIYIFIHIIRDPVNGANKLCRVNLSFMTKFVKKKKDGDARMVRVFPFDFSKAFDTVYVPHEILCNKLNILL